MAGDRWLLLPTAELSAQLRPRAIPLALIRLSPEESVGALLRLPATFEDLVARGLSRTEIARSSGFSVRTVERRLAALREHHGAKTRAELTAILARRTGSPGGNAPTNDGGRHVAQVETGDTQTAGEWT